MEALLGSKLLTRDGEKSTSEALAGAKAVGLYAQPPRPNLALTALTQYLTHRSLTVD